MGPTYLRQLTKKGSDKGGRPLKHDETALFVATFFRHL